MLGKTTLPIVTIWSSLPSPPGFALSSVLSFHLISLKIQGNTWKYTYILNAVYKCCKMSINFVFMMHALRHRIYKLSPTQQRHRNTIKNKMRNTLFTNAEPINRWHLTAAINFDRFKFSQKTKLSTQNRKLNGAQHKTYVIPWWTTELRRVLQMMRSVHCTITMAVKKAVWHVYSSTLRWAYVCNGNAFALSNNTHMTLIS